MNKMNWNKFLLVFVFPLLVVIVGIAAVSLSEWAVAGVLIGAFALAMLIDRAWHVQMVAGAIFSVIMAFLLNAANVSGKGFAAGEFGPALSYGLLIMVAFVFELIQEKLLRDLFPTTESEAKPTTKADQNPAPSTQKNVSQNVTHASNHGNGKEKAPQNQPSTLPTGNGDKTTSALPIQPVKDGVITSKPDPKPSSRYERKDAVLELVHSISESGDELQTLFEAFVQFCGLGIITKKIADADPFKGPEVLSFIKNRLGSIEAPKYEINDEDSPLLVYLNKYPPALLQVFLMFVEAKKAGRELEWNALDSTFQDFIKQQTKISGNNRPNGNRQFQKPAVAGS